MGGGGDMVACPICGKSIRSSEADEHVDACLSMGPLLAFDPPDSPDRTEETQLIKRNNKKVQFASDAKPAVGATANAVGVASTATLPSSAPTLPSASSSVGSSNAFGLYDEINELNYFSVLEQRKKQEEADRLLAQRLQEELERETQSATPRVPVAATTNNTAVVIGRPVIASSSSSSSSSAPVTNNWSNLADEEELEKEARDRILALVLQAEEQDSREARMRELKEREKRDKEIAEQLNRIQQEEERKKVQRDKEIAEELARKQREAEKLREESKKFDSAVDLIREEVLTLEEEKQKLEKELEKLRKKAEKIDYSVGEVRYPDTWNYCDSNYSTFDVARGSNEWKRVQNKVHETTYRQISRIQRIQNKNLFKWYSLRKEEIRRENAGFDNEDWAFHGSRSNAYDTIIKEGFDLRVANLSGALGAGIYFSNQASHSLNFASNNKLLYCRIIKGAVGTGMQGLRRPPNKPNGKLYDSVGNSSVTVLFDNHQAYPEYIITLAWS